MKLNTMDEYLAEIQGMSIPQNAIFHTNPSLTEKIGHLGELLPFCGNTTVFCCPPKTALIWHNYSTNCT